MKRAFTLIELLVVIVVIAILMSISFGLLNVGKDDEARRNTIVKIQKLENAMGGYYAAFGSYPPVPVTGSRNIFQKINQWGIQQIDGNDAEPDYDELNPDRVEAACRSQMMGASWPWGHRVEAEKINRLFAIAKKHHDAGSGDLSNPLFALSPEALEDVGRVNALAKSKPSWCNVQVFRFGLISFLLPRYLVMMDQNPDNNGFGAVKQWAGSNELPSKFDDGVTYSSWGEVSKKVRRQDGSQGEFDNAEEALEIGLLPSQIVTTRWLPNLEGSLMILNPCRKKFEYYGVDLMSRDDQTPYSLKNFASKTSVDPGMFFPIYSSCDGQSGVAAGYEKPYVLDGVTMVDAYNRELYYYSPPPYQSYCLWSSGPNKVTFPPWMSDKEIDALGPDDAKKARSWKADDIMHMSN